VILTKKEWVCVLLILVVSVYVSAKEDLDFIDPNEIDFGCKTLAPNGTNIYGIISINQTWNAAGSPYYIAGNTLIEANATVVVEDSVEVIFLNSSYLFYVDGVLLTVNRSTPGISKSMVSPTGRALLYVRNGDGYLSGVFIENLRIMGRIHWIIDSEVQNSYFDNIDNVGGDIFNVTVHDNTFINISDLEIFEADTIDIRGNTFTKSSLDARGNYIHLFDNSINCSGYSLSIDAEDTLEMENNNFSNCSIGARSNDLSILDNSLNLGNLDIVLLEHSSPMEWIISVYNNTLERNDFEMNVRNEDEQSNLTLYIQNNTFRNSSMELYFEYEEESSFIAYITNNTFSKYTDSAITISSEFDECSPRGCTLTFSGNTISSSMSGLRVNDFGRQGNLTITHNTIQGYSVTINATTPTTTLPTSNSVGLYLDVYCGSGNNCRIEDNEILFYSVGADISDCRYSHLENNDFLYNGIGLRLNSRIGAIQNNNIANNIQYNAYANFGYQYTINLANNYWGTNDTYEIENMIYDYYDDWDKGKIIYEPFLTEPVGELPVSTTTTSASTTTSSITTSAASTTTTTISTTTTTLVQSYSIPKLIEIKGRLSSSSGNPLTGDYNMTFRIYNQSTGGTSLWTESHTGVNAVRVVNGQFNVILGRINNLNVTFIGDMWVGIEVENDGEMTPRKRFIPVPFAHRAEFANQLDPKCPADMVDMGSYCIDKNVNADNVFLRHVLDCWTEGKRMCNIEEWYLACLSSTEMEDKGGVEYLSGTHYKTSNSYCTTTSIGSGFGTPRPARCCL